MINFGNESFKDKLKIQLKNYLSYWYVKSYSQEGEDMILNRIYEHKNDGFYVDIGAHHPCRFSNTYLFYKKGWNGINIDAAPGSMKAFENIRPRDINIETPVSDKEQELNYFMFNDGALNTLDAQRAKAIEDESDGQYRVIEKVKLKTQPLSEILKNNVPPGKHIDFISVDVEGLDLQVLKSNDWDHFSPDFLLVEDQEPSLEKVFSSDLSQYLKEKGYNLYCRTVSTCLYKRMN